MPQSSACSKRNEMNPPPMVAACASRATMVQFLDVSGDQQRMLQRWKSIPCNSLDICSEECHRMSQMTLDPKLQLSRASTGCLRQWSSSIRRRLLCSIQPTLCVDQSFSLLLFKNHSWHSHSFSPFKWHGLAIENATLHDEVESSPQIPQVASTFQPSQTRSCHLLQETQDVC